MTMSNSKKNWIIIGLTAAFYGSCLLIQNLYSKKVVKNLEWKSED